MHCYTLESVVHRAPSRLLCQAQLVAYCKEVHFCPFWLCRPCTILNQLKLNSSRVSIKCLKNILNIVHRATTLKIPDTAWYSYLPTQIGGCTVTLHMLASRWIFAAASHRWWDHNPQLSELAELLLELCGALELAPRLKGCSSCLSAFFHPRFAKGKNVSISAATLVWLWCLEKKQNILVY